MNDSEFIRAIEDCTLPAAEFTHTAHVRLGYLYLCSGSFAQAIERTSCTIRRYATSLGAPQKYHETITVAYLALIHERLAENGDGGGWEGFADANADLFDRGLLLRSYRAVQLDSELARRVFVLPRADVTSSRASQTRGGPRQSISSSGSRSPPGSTQ